MFEEFLSQRLAQLRQAKGVSARDMSLSLGQSPSYINRIENKANFPSMQSFFYICEYLGITPADFFDVENQNPAEYRELFRQLNRLAPSDLELVKAIIKRCQR